MARQKKPPGGPDRRSGPRVFLSTHEWVGKKILRHAPANPFMRFARRAVNWRRQTFHFFSGFPSIRLFTPNRETRRIKETPDRGPEGIFLKGTDQGSPLIPLIESEETVERKTFLLVPSEVRRIYYLGGPRHIGAPGGMYIIMWT